MIDGYKLIQEHLEHNNKIRRRKNTIERQLKKLLKEYFSLNEETLKETEERLKADNFATPCK